MLWGTHWRHVIPPPPAPTGQRPGAGGPVSGSEGGRAEHGIPQACLESSSLTDCDSQTYTKGLAFVFFLGLNA